MKATHALRKPMGCGPRARIDSILVSITPANNAMSSLP